MTQYEQVLKTFITLSECRNFTQTAERLHVTQSTVTKRIADLEEELGKKLFERNNKTVALTGEGEIYLQYATRILDLLEESFQKVNLSRKYERTLRIGSTNFIYDIYLLGKLQKYRQEDVAVKIVLNHSERLIQMLQDNLLDEVYSFAPFFKKGIKCEDFHEDRFVLVTQHENREYEDGICLQELNAIDYLLCNFTVENLGNYIKELFIPFQQFCFEIDNSSKLLNYLIEYGGYSFLPEKMVEKYINDKVLRAVPLIDFEAPRVKSYRIYRE